MNAGKRNAHHIVRDIAHARASDEGNTFSVKFWDCDKADFAVEAPAGFVTLTGFTCFYCLPTRKPTPRFQ